MSSLSFTLMIMELLVISTEVPAVMPVIVILQNNYTPRRRRHIIAIVTHTKGEKRTKSASSINRSHPIGSEKNGGLEPATISHSSVTSPSRAAVIDITHQFKYATSKYTNRYEEFASSLQRANCWVIASRKDLSTQVSLVV